MTDTECDRVVATTGLKERVWGSGMEGTSAQDHTQTGLLLFPSQRIDARTHVSHSFSFLSSSTCCSPDNPFDAFGF